MNARHRWLIEGMVRRAVATDAPLLAAPLSRYAAREELAWEELARRVGGTPETLNQVALCRPPRPERFVEDVAAIAAGQCDADRLLAILRQLQVLETFSNFPRDRLPRASEAEAPGVLLATRDREAEAPEAPLQADVREEVAINETPSMGREPRG